MIEIFEGSCQCGAVKYRATGTAATLFACHCTDCQRQSSSAFGMALWVRDADLQLLSGELKEWVRTTPMGRKSVCKFCPVCGTRLFHLGNSQFLSIKPGTLDNAKELWPVGHLWTQSKQRWVQLPEGSLQYEGNPPDFAELCAAWDTLHH